MLVVLAVIIAVNLVNGVVTHDIDFMWYVWNESTLNECVCACVCHRSVKCRSKCASSEMDAPLSPPILISPKCHTGSQKHVRNIPAAASNDSVLFFVFTL